MRLTRGMTLETRAWNQLRNIMHSKTLEVQDAKETGFSRNLK